MPNTVSARKRLRQALKHRIRNRAVRTAVRRAIRRVRDLIAQNDLEAAQQAAREDYSVLDRAVKKGVLHRNNAARRKSRLMHRLNAALAAASAAEASSAGMA